MVPSRMRLQQLLNLVMPRAQRSRAPREQPVEGAIFLCQPEALWIPGSLKRPTLNSLNHGSKPLGKSRVLNAGPVFRNMRVPSILRPSGRLR